MVLSTHQSYHSHSIHMVSAATFQTFAYNEYLTEQEKKILQIYFSMRSHHLRFSSYGLEISHTGDNQECTRAHTRGESESESESENGGSCSK